MIGDEITKISNQKAADPNKTMDDLSKNNQIYFEEIRQEQGYDEPEDLSKDSVYTKFTEKQVEEAQGKIS